jgi:glycerol-3-phosphate dehydrogenase (NAD(P)+)
MTKHLSVVGGGAWGVALATAGQAAGSSVMLYSRRKHDDLPPAVQHTEDLGALARHARTILLAVPSKHVRELARELGDHLDGNHILVHGIRGLVSRPSSDPAWEGDELATISAVLREETPARRFGALGGPVLTDELAKGSPSVMVVASHYPEVLDEVKSTLAGASVRIYTTDDLLGLEWASALMSILGIAVGFARGAGVAAGLASAFAIRGVHESARVAVAAGAHERTFLGLGGFGDLLAAMSQNARPEVRLGEALAKGASIEAAVKELGQRIEAIELAPRVAEFAERHKVPAPILTTVAEGILGQKSAPELVQRLMSAPITTGHA